MFERQPDQKEKSQDLSERPDKQEVNDEFVAELLEWQNELDNLNAAVAEDKGYSYVMDARKLPNNVFRGGLLEYLVKHQNLRHIDTIMLSGEQVKPGIFRSSVKWSEKNFNDFMKIINEMKIKRLSLDGCELTPEIGVVIGEALKNNTSLEELLVTSNQLQNKGIMAILKGLEENTTLKTLSSRSYNLSRYHWSSRELNALKGLILANKTLEKILLPDNQINRPEHIRILIEAYQSIKDREPATIKGFELGLHDIPNFNRENAANDELEKWAKVRFINH